MLQGFSRSTRLLSWASRCRGLGGIAVKSGFFDGLHRRLGEGISFKGADSVAELLSFGLNLRGGFGCFVLGGFAGERRVAFGLTEPRHGSDATHMETRAVRETRDGEPGWRIDGRKMWITGMHVATHCAAFCRTSGKDGDAKGISCLLVPIDTPGMVVDEYMWTFNMPTDHPRMHFENCWVPESAVLGPVDASALGGFGLIIYLWWRGEVKAELKVSIVAE